MARTCAEFSALFRYRAMHIARRFRRPALPTWLLLALALPLGACATREAAASACDFGLPAQSITLYFGLATAADAEVSEAAWRGFEGAALQSLLPSGFTAHRGHGTWKDPRSGAVSHDATYVVTAVVPLSESGADIARAAAGAYKRFNAAQSAIGVEVARVCADFDVRSVQ